MKKLLLLILILGLAFSPASFGMMCGLSSANNAGECVEQVTLASGETTIVSAGMVLVYNLDATTPKQGSYEVRVATATSDNTFVAGFAKGRIVSGQQGLVVVRGLVNARIKGNEEAISSGDPLYVSTSGDVANYPPAASSDLVGFALDDSASGDTQNQIFVTIV